MAMLRVVLALAASQPFARAALDAGSENPFMQDFDWATFANETYGTPVDADWWGDFSDDPHHYALFHIFQTMGAAPGGAERLFRKAPQSRRRGADGVAAAPRRRGAGRIAAGPGTGSRRRRRPDADRPIRSGPPNPGHGRKADQ